MYYDGFSVPGIFIRAENRAGARVWGVRGIIREAIERGGLEYIEAVTRTIESTGALDYTARLAAEEAGRAIAQLAVLPESPAKEALTGLARFAVSRRY